MIPFLDSALKSIHKQYYDDLVDRMNYYYSTLILLFLAILVSAKQYVGNPINCWFPAHFKDFWIKYAESYCFMTNTFYVPWEESVGSKYDPKHRSRHINYYQWMPIILATQALLFYLPNLLWKMLNWQSGINVKSILKMASEADISDEEKRKKTLTTLAKYIEDSLSLQAELDSINGFRQLFCLRYGCANTYLTCLYIFTKLLYILNVVGQFMMLNSLFNGTPNYVIWGFKSFWDVIRGNEWKDSGHFPHVTLCDFGVREVGQPMNYTVQCVLVINMFNEKIYLFLWVWLCFVGFCTVVNFLYWLFALVPSGCRYRFIHKYLRIGAEMTNSPNDRYLVEKFVGQALRSDGVLLLRFISGHTGDLLVTELMFRLFQEWYEKIKQRRGEIDKLPLNFVRESSVATLNEMPKHSSQCASSQNGFSESLYDVDKKCNQQYPTTVTNGVLKPTAPKVERIPTIA